MILQSISTTFTVTFSILENGVNFKYWNVQLHASPSIFFPKEKKMIILIKKLHTKVCIVPASRRVTSWDRIICDVFPSFVHIKQKKTCWVEKIVCKISPMGSFLPEKIEYTAFCSFVCHRVYTVTKPVCNNFSHWELPVRKKL